MGGDPALPTSPLLHVLQDHLFWPNQWLICLNKIVGGFLSLFLFLPSSLFNFIKKKKKLWLQCIACRTLHLLYWKDEVLTTGPPGKASLSFRCWDFSA